MGRKFKVEINRRTPELAFTLPMECSAVTALPEGPEWSYELKFDGYRAQAIHTVGGVRLLSRNGKDLGAHFPDVLSDLACAIPSNASVDGELCALDERGRPSFQLLQNAAQMHTPLAFYAFDVLNLGGRNLTQCHLTDRRSMLREFIRPSEAVQFSHAFDVSAAQMMSLVRKHRLEGIIAKRRDSCYEPAQRSGAWVKLRLVRAQEFVIGGFAPGSYGIDSLIIGFYDAGRLLYCARVSNGFVPATRRDVYSRLWPLIIKNCPFLNLPEADDGGRNQAIHAAKMRDCVWVRPELVGQFAFLEWTVSDRLRHVRFLGLREDKRAREVVREP